MSFKLVSFLHLFKDKTVALFAR